MEAYKLTEMLGRLRTIGQEENGEAAGIVPDLVVLDDEAIAITSAIEARLAAAEAAQRDAEGRVRVLAEALSSLTESPPVFRDYSGTDEDTCAYCHEPLEGCEGRRRGEHWAGCKWVAARAALAPATPATEAGDAPGTGGDEGVR
jgi:hypothetical protein